MRYYAIIPNDPVGEVGAKAEGLLIDNDLLWVGPSVSVSKYNNFSCSKVRF